MSSRNLCSPINDITLEPNMSSFTLSKSPPFTIALNATDIKGAMTRMDSDETFGANVPTAILSAVWEKGVVRDVLLFQRKSEGGQTIHGPKVSLWICLLRDPKVNTSANSLESLPMIIVLLRKFCDESFQLRLPISSAALPSRGDQRGLLGCGQVRESFKTRRPVLFQQASHAVWCCHNESKEFPGALMEFHFGKTPQSMSF